VAASDPHTGYQLEGQTIAQVGFFGTAPAGARPNVAGSRGGNIALANLLTALASLGLIARLESAIARPKAPAAGDRAWAELARATCAAFAAYTTRTTCTHSHR
jgi:hypothetical protein